MSQGDSRLRGPATGSARAGSRGGLYDDPELPNSPLTAAHNQALRSPPTGVPPLGERDQKRFSNW